jgi:hypothetical protein
MNQKNTRSAFFAGQQLAVCKMALLLAFKK